MLNTLILAAGLGARLRPLTERIAKPLIPIADSSPLARQASLAKSLGSDKIHANAHHLAEQVQAAAGGLGIEKVWLEQELLGTGGPIRRMRREGEQGELLVLNGDCEHSLDVGRFLEQARGSGASCALLAISNENINTLCIDDKNLLCGIKNKFGNESSRCATFTGISWYSQKAWDKIAEGDESGALDVRDFWERLCAEGEAPLVCEAEGRWIDIGSPDGLMDAINSRLEEIGAENWENGYSESFALAGSAGSGRKYYRMQAAGHSLILQQSHGQDSDFERFARYGRLFQKLGLPTPEIYAVSEKERRIAMQDFGAMRLCDAPQPLVYYPAVLERLIIWQETGSEAFKADKELAGRIFAESDYLWETSYFSENYLSGYLGLKDMPSNNMEGLFLDLARRAAAHPRVLMHRDFQSQNIMVGSLGFVDFQGARNGSIYYDAASLLWDPYMMLPAKEIERLFMLWYKSSPKLKDTWPAEAWQGFLEAGAQRLMQALGAFCFLSMKKGIKSFEQFIEPGAKRLCELAKLAGMPDFFISAVKGKK